VVGVTAGSLLVVVGCSTVTGGTAVVDTKAAPAYRSSITASLSASAATSSERESLSQQSLTTQAVHNSCDTLGKSSGDAVSAVNDYVGALNSHGPDVGSKEGPAIDSLHKSADQVTSSLSGVLSVQLHDALTAYADAARAVADAINRHVSPDDFNNAIDKFNDVKSTAIDQCKAAY
jgi:hypothetical protein